MSAMETKLLKSAIVVCKAATPLPPRAISYTLGLSFWVTRVALILLFLEWPTIGPGPPLIPSIGPGIPNSWSWGGSLISPSLVTITGLVPCKHPAGLVYDRPSLLNSGPCLAQGIHTVQKVSCVFALNFIGYQPYSLSIFAVAGAWV